MHIALSRDFNDLHMEIFLAIESEPGISVEAQRQLLGECIMAAEESVRQVCARYHEHWRENTREDEP